LQVAAKELKSNVAFMQFSVPDTGSEALGCLKDVLLASIAESYGKM
jgi:hypothetical protein